MRKYKVKRFLATQLSSPALQMEQFLNDHEISPLDIISIVPLRGDLVLTYLVSDPAYIPLSDLPELELVARQS